VPEFYTKGCLLNAFQLTWASHRQAKVLSFEKSEKEFDLGRRLSLSVEDAVPDLRKRS